jgi:hypothetical protein
MCVAKNGLTRVYKQHLISIFMNLVPLSGVSLKVSAPWATVVFSTPLNLHLKVQNQSPNTTSNVLKR